MTQASGQPAGAEPESWLPRLLLTLVAVAVALLLTVLLRQWIPHTLFIFFYVAVMAGAVLGGIRLAGVALVASLLAAEVVLYGQGGDLDLSPPVLARNAALVAVSAAGVLLIERIRRARAAAESRRQEAEALAARLSEQTSQLELQVTESEALAEELETTNRQMQEQAAAALTAGIRSERLQRLTAQLLEAVGEIAVGRVITQDAREAVAAAGAIVATSRENDRLRVVAAEGPGAAAAEHEPLAEAARALLEAALATGEPAWIADVAAVLDRYPGLEALAPGHRSWCVLPLRADRRQLGVMAFSFTRAGEFEPEDRSFLLLLAQQSAQALERARLHETSLRARVRAEFAERRLALLAEASARLSASLDYEATLASMAELAVPEFADWCVVHLQNEHEGPRLVALEHSDPARAQVRRELEARTPNGGLMLAGYRAVVVEGSPEHVATFTERTLRTAASGEQDLAALRALGLRSQMTVPIRGENAVWGAMAFTSAESGRPFSEADIRLAVELGRRAGQAVDNARLYQAAHFASEAKSNFLAVMSHELRTPLNAIIGYSDLLLLGVPSEIPERARQQIERIRSASNSLLHLVEEVLSFSRIEAGKEEIRISPVNLSVLLSDLVAMIEPLAAEKKLAVHLDIPDYPVKLISDERKISQIVTNLLSNAVKFTENGEIRVGVVREESSIRVAVRDTGIGIPEEHLERIFDPFWQVEQSSTRRFGGTGLGLGVARKLAKLLEGRLEVESREGRGSTFTLSLPRHTPGMNRQT